ncbi:hypothetical protein Leryth_025960 [Lithospermum erythrorhizon]|nr:hypothetical protein Leryth_025960 [Lithospermum erythrorhizon]
MVTSMYLLITLSFHKAKSESSHLSECNALVFMSLASNTYFVQAKPETVDKVCSIVRKQLALASVWRVEYDFKGSVECDATWYAEQYNNHHMQNIIDYIKEEEEKCT